MDSIEKPKLKKNSKKSDKKGFHKDIQYEIDYYEYQKNLDNKSILEYRNTEYLSAKEKNDLENKFSKPRNESQYKFLTYLKKKDSRIVIASGPAGTGKTLFGVEEAIRNYLYGNCEKLIFTRPVVTVDEDIGYLPGTIEEKLGPFVRPLFDILYNFLSPKEVEGMISDKIIEISPIGMLRGRTFKNSFIIADEMQNSTISQMKMLLTRIGENSKLVITGDLEQNDRHGEMNGLEDFLNKIRGRRSDSINSVEFDKSDIEREKVVQEVLEIYSANNTPYDDVSKSTDNSVDNNLYM
jgi:phosphate starvation-inducible PhoH-like protein